MSDDKFNDDFLKELEEAENILKGEFCSNKDTKPIPSSEYTENKTIKQTDTIPNVIDPNINDNEIKKFQDMLGNLMKNLSLDQNESEEFNNIDKNQLFEKLNNEISEIEKKIQFVENTKSKVGNIDSKKDSYNPFIDAFKGISEESNSNKEIKGLFEGMGMGNEFNEIFGNFNSKDNKNVSELMGILNSINETDQKDGGELNMNEIFVQLFDVLLKEDVLSVPLSTIKKKLEEYNLKYKGKIGEEEIKKYEQIMKYIDEILLEIKKTNPNKEYVIQIFEKLHMIGELPAEIMNENDENMGMLSLAQNLFKK